MPFPRPDDALPPLAVMPASGAAPDVRMAATGEESEWFRQLSPALQDEYRAKWAATAGRHVERRTTWRRSFGRGALRGGVVFLLTHLMFGFGGGAGIAAAAAVGALLGVAWKFINAGPMRSALTAAPIYACVWLATTPTLALFPLLCFATLLVMAFSAAAGQSREFRQGDGEE
jgi:hypothetical protein